MAWAIDSLISWGQTGAAAGGRRRLVGAFARSISIGPRCDMDPLIRMYCLRISSAAIWEISRNPFPFFSLFVIPFSFSSAGSCSSSFSSILFFKFFLVPFQRFGLAISPVCHHSNELFSVFFFSIFFHVYIYLNFVFSRLVVII